MATSCNYRKFICVRFWIRATAKGQCFWRMYHVSENKRCRHNFVWFYRWMLLSSVSGWVFVPAACSTCFKAFLWGCEVTSHLLHLFSVSPLCVFKWFAWVGLLHLLLVQLVPKVSLGEAQHRSPGVFIEQLNMQSFYDQPSRFRYLGRFTIENRYFTQENTKVGMISWSPIFYRKYIFWFHL